MEAIIIDILVAGVLVAASAAFISTWLAIYFYHRGWILSLRQRKSTRKITTVGTKAIKNGVIYGIVGAIFMGIMIGIMIFMNLTPFTYESKEYLVATLAFLTTYEVSYKAIHAVRNGEIA